MALEPQKKDVSYQYGRLLAVFEKLERDTYDSNEQREPNAIRMQSVFAKRQPDHLGAVEKGVLPQAGAWRQNKIRPHH